MVPWIDQRRRQDGKGGFASNRMKNLRLRGEPSDTANAFQVRCRRLFQDGITVVRVAAVLWFAGLFTELINHLWKSHFIRFAHSHVDNLGVWMSRHSSTFGPLNLLELVDRRRFPVQTSADPFRK